MSGRSVEERLIVLGASLLADRRLGEPSEGMHPVVWMGRALSLMAEYAPKTEKARLFYGAAGVSLLAGGSALTARLAADALPGWVGAVVEAWLLKTCLSYRALEEAGKAVVEPLEAGDIDGAREALISLVSRERSSLDSSLVAAAAIESLAENLSDSLVAPSLAYATFGLPGAFFYRAANTADAMIGYREERFEHLGKFAAKLDDALNFVPARATALALVAASGERAPAAWAALSRNRGATASPNAGWPMSAAAGAIGAALEKPGHYVLNAGARQPEAKDIRRAIALCRRAAVLCGLVAAALVISATVRGRAAPSTGGIPGFGRQVSGIFLRMASGRRLKPLLRDGAACASVFGGSGL